VQGQEPSGAASSADLASGDASGWR
jgi:hypothetical protein